MSKKIKYVGIGLVAVILLASAFVFVGQVKATTIDFFVDTLSNLTYSQTSNHDFVFAPVHNIVANDVITITLPSFTGVGTVVQADLTTFTDNGVTIPLGLCASSTSNWEPTFSESPERITITACSAATTIPAGDTVELTVSNTKITNPDGTANPYTLTLTGPAGDSGTTQIDIVGPQDVNVGGTVTQSITFTVGTHAVSFGQLSASHAKTSTHSILMSTNAASGMQITVNGTTLHYPAVTPTKFITACATNCASVHGTQQFGLNLAANTATGDLSTAVPLFTVENPPTNPISAIPTGTAPIGVAAANYNTADSFRFVTGEVVASSAGPINTTTYVVSYLANISGSTAAGTYTTTLTYIATTFF